MDFVGAEGGRRRLRKRCSVDVRAVRYTPDAVARLALRPKRSHRRNLAVESRIDLLGDDLRGPTAPVAADLLGRRPLGEGARHIALRGRRLTQRTHLAERKVERPAGREEAALRLPLLLGGLIVKHRRKLRKARQVRLGVRGILDRVRRVQEIRNREVGAVLLADDVRALRVRDVELLGADVAGLEIPDHDFAIELGKVGQAGFRHGSKPADELVGARDFLNPRLPVRTGVQLRLEVGQLALVEAGVGRRKRVRLDLLLEDPLENLVDRSVLRAGGSLRRCSEGDARLRKCADEGQARSCAGGRKKLTAIHEALPSARTRLGTLKAARAGRKSVRRSEQPLVGFPSARPRADTA